MNPVQAEMQSALLSDAQRIEDIVTISKRAKMLRNFKRLSSTCGKVINRFKRKSGKKTIYFSSMAVKSQSFRFIRRNPYGI